MVVRKDRGMHIPYMNVLKTDSIVGYVVFDFDLLLSDDKGFKFSANYNSNNKRQRLSTTTNNTNHNQLASVVVI